MKPSLSNNEIKRIKSLSQKKFRDEYNLFVAEGEKIVDEALRSGYEIEAVYRREEIGEDKMSRISQLSSPSPVLAVIRKPAQEQIQIPSKGLFLGLDSLRDPGNLGTVIRIADWFGINAIFASYDTVDVFNPKVVQSTMGAIFRVRFHYCDLESICKGFIESGGNESEGISDRISKIVSDRLFIPPYPADDPGSESLNVSVATAVTVAEFRRRIR